MNFFYLLNLFSATTLGLYPLKRRRLTAIRISTLNLRRHGDCLRFIMWILIAIRRCLLSIASKPPVRLDKVGNISYSRFSSVVLWCPLGVTWANMLVAVQWPLKRAPHLLMATQWPLKRAPPLCGSVWYGGVEAHWSFLHYGESETWTWSMSLGEYRLWFDFFGWWGTSDFYNINLECCIDKWWRWMIAQTSVQIRWETLSSVLSPNLARSLDAPRLDVIMMVSLWTCRGIKKSKPESRGFENSRDLAVRHLTA